MQWQTVQRDFVARTMTILTQYDDYLSDKRSGSKDVEELEVTLLVNCLTGLLVVPYELAHRKGDPEHVKVCADDITSIKNLGANWGLGNVVIERICDFQHKPFEPTHDASLRLFVYRMRNSLAHSRFQDGTKYIRAGVGIVSQTASSDPNRSRIEKLTFQDMKSRFKAVIPVSSLRTFAETFATEVLKPLQDERT